MYSPNFSPENKGDDSYLFASGKEVTKFKAKDSEIKANQLALGSVSISTNLSSNDIEVSKLYSAIRNHEILDIHKYLMGKNNIV